MKARRDLRNATGTRAARASSAANELNVTPANRRLCQGGCAGTMQQAITWNNLSNPKLPSDATYINTNGTAIGERFVAKR